MVEHRIGTQEEWQSERDELPKERRISIALTLDGRYDSSVWVRQ